MPVEKLEALVLREQAAGETNKQLIVLARGRGRMLLSARGARKPQSKLLAVAQPFVYGEYLVYPGRGFASITEGTVLRGFYGLRRELSRLGAAAYCAELCEQAAPEGVEADGILRLALTTLAVLSKTEFSPRLAACIFELALLSESGFLAEAVDLAQSFGLCPGAEAAAAYIQEHRGPELFRFGVSPEVLGELERMSCRLVGETFAYRPKSRDFLRNLD